VSRPKAWYPRYPEDFIAATQHLTLEELGAYDRLLDFHFLHDSIPSDIKRIALIIGASSQKTRKLWQVLSQFFYEKDGAFFNKRMVKEIAKAAEISTKRSEAAKKKWAASADASADAIADTTHNPQPTYKDKTPNVQTASRFDEWWDAYDLKKNRKKALEIWKRRKLDGMADELIADAQNRHQHDADWKRGFQPHPTTYLNGDRWNDELATPRQGTNRPVVRETAHERSQRIIRERADEIAKSL
jgi:uncharacterized protein YdaU (DUF1376 family)